MDISNISPEIKSEIMTVLKEWGIENPTKADQMRAAREVFHVRGVAPVGGFDLLLAHLTIPGNP